MMTPQQQIKKNILCICDPERIEEQVFCDMLKQDEYSIHCVYQKNDMNKCLQDIKIDIVLVSVHILYSNPYDLCFEISSHQKNFPILMIASSPDAVDIPKAFAMGVSDIILSPYIKPLIWSRIKTFLYLNYLEASIKTKNHEKYLEKHENVDVSDQKKEVHRKRFQFSNTRILLAEDNDVNQQLMKNILELSGIQIDIAQNGQEAIDLIQSLINQQSPMFDAILMDIQMPELDGFSASQQIQKILENHKQPEVPIIAITAHTTTHSREKCMRAGMVDYLAKPIDPEKCLDVISQWIHSDKLIKADEQSFHPTTKTISSLENKISGLNIKTGLKRAAQNETLYKNMLLDFYNDYQETGKKLFYLYESNKKDDLRIMAHTLKGLGGNIGAEQMQKYAMQMEQSIKEDDEKRIKLTISQVVDAINILLDSIKANLHLLEEKIPRHCQENDHQKEVCEDELETELNDLYEYIDQGRTKAMQTFNGLFKQLEKRFADDTERLKQLILSYEFEKAQIIIHHMLNSLELHEK